MLRLHWNTYDEIMESIESELLIPTKVSIISDHSNGNVLSVSAKL